MKVHKVGEPMQRIGMDILGPLPETYKGNKYILVVIDYFTRWTEAYAIKNQEARTVAEVLLENFVTRFGVPHVIHTDQGSNFESQLFADQSCVICWGYIKHGQPLTGRSLMALWKCLIGHLSKC